MNLFSFINKSIVAKMTVLFTGLLLVIFLYMSIYYPAKQKESALDDAYEKVALLSEMLSFSIGAGFYDENIELAVKAFNWAKNNENVTYVAILDANNELFVDYNPNFLSINPKAYAKVEKIEVTNDQVQVSKPIMYEDQYNGTIVMIYSLAKVNNAIASNRLFSLLWNTLLLVTALGLFIFFLKKITTNLNTLIGLAKAVGNGDYTQKVSISSHDEIGTLANTFGEMTVKIQSAMTEVEQQNWVKTGISELNERMRGEQDVTELAQKIISYTAEYLEAQVGAIYILNEQKELRMVGSHAYTTRKNLSNTFKLGEGLVGQAALEKKDVIITNVPDDYIKITSGLGESSPINILVTPFIYEGNVKGVIELGTFGQFTKLQLQFLQQTTENIAIAFNTAESRVELKKLLSETQSQAEELKSQQEELQVTNEELQSQQEELRVANEELEEQAENLKQSEETLKKQQTELQKSNEELEKQTSILKERQEEIENKNNALEIARNEIEHKANELELTSKYKSEFLANMSHELRTPMNSIQILSKLLADNTSGNLTEKQLNFAKTINSSGEDLLNLINEILDLSKIEAGKMTLNIEKMSLKILPAYFKQNFEHVTSDKNLYLKVETAKNLPENIITDRQRVEQVLKNLLSNAIKFTSNGGITIKITRPDKNLISSTSQDLDPKHSIAISVIDTGVGIPKDKMDLIFQAFQQADGTTSRKYGGTGLGLSISRELARLLKGDIFLQSEENKGSTFTLVLPEEIEGAEIPEADIEESESEVTAVAPPEKKTVEIKSEIRDDRNDIKENDKSVLIIEDDVEFSKILFDYSREKGFKCLIANDGEAGLQLANQFLPSSIILDIGLPRIDGWTVMERLKEDSSTRHIPVYFISGQDKKIAAMRMGAIGYLTKPVNPDDLNSAFSLIEETINKKIKKLLVIEDDEAMRNSILELVGGDDISITTSDKGKLALKLLKKEAFDCIIVDLGLSDISGFDLIEQINSDTKIKDIPIIVYTGKELTKQEDARLRKNAESIIIKGAKSPDRLLDEVSLFLHRVNTSASKKKKDIKSSTPVTIDDGTFKDKTILLVDDDIRNIYAISSILEEKDMNILVAENGIEAIEKLDQNENTDLILMDIMMPEMDGYEAMGKIRKQKKYKDMPIIALTAKAMKGDRQKCIDAGANDYLSKPIDVEKLLSILHVWLYK